MNSNTLDSLNASLSQFDPWAMGATPFVWLLICYFAFVAYLKFRKTPVFRFRHLKFVRSRMERAIAGDLSHIVDVYREVREAVVSYEFSRTELGMTLDDFLAQLMSKVNHEIGGLEEIIVVVNRCDKGGGTITRKGRRTLSRTQKNLKQLRATGSQLGQLAFHN